MDLVFLRRVQENLNSQKPEERELAVKTLGQPNDPVARKALKKLLRHPLRDVRVHAAVLLSKQEPSATIPILIEGLSYDADGEMKELRRESVEALVALGSSSIPALLTALDSPDETTWANVAQILVLIHDAVAVEKLLQILRQKAHGDFLGPRDKIIEALGELGDRRAVPELVAILASPKEKDSTKRKAVWAIGKIGDRNIIPSLIEASKRLDRGTLALMVYVLGLLGDDRAIPMLADLLGDNAPADDGRIHLSTQPMSEIASEALRRIGTDRAMKEMNKKK